jgi:hypothetical protein
MRFSFKINNHNKTSPKNNRRATPKITKFKKDKLIKNKPQNNVKRTQKMRKKMGNH